MMETDLDIFHMEWDEIKEDERVKRFLSDNHISCSHFLPEKVDPILSVITGKNVSFFLPRYNFCIDIPLFDFCYLWATFRNFFNYAYGDKNPWLNKKEIYRLFGINQSVYNFFNVARNEIRRCDSSIGLASCLLKYKAIAEHKGYTNDDTINYNTIIEIYLKEHPNASHKEVFYLGINIGREM